MPENTHIVSAFDKDLAEIQNKISEMGEHAAKVLTTALKAVKKRDAVLAQEAIDMDKVLDNFEEEIEERATQVIALRQPMAQDLRVLISAIKIATTLERIGDLSKNIARRALYLSDGGKIKITGSIVQMGKATRQQLDSIMTAHKSLDSDLAVEIWQTDVELDEMYNSIFREVVTYMMDDSRMIGAGSQLLFIAKNLERIGDHTTHISEMIYYIVNGKPLGDERPKGEPLGFRAED
ncbi:MAG: phosphate signaling complex protein PhoU [Rhodobacteraceae bacterium]|nr:phosphate signaling complex protein PhoU [Paracoccaceae bacterium]